MSFLQKKIGCQNSIGLGRAFVVFFLAYGDLVVAIYADSLFSAQLIDDKVAPLCKFKLVSL